jgi:hypothetical protein
MTLGLSAAAGARARTANQIQSVRVGSPIIVPDNFGDTWVTAWADDGHLYTPSNDTLCFGIPEFFTNDQVKLFQGDFPRFAKQLTPEQRQEWQYGPVGFNRLEGSDPQHLRGVTVNRMLDYMTHDGYRAMLEDPSKSSADGRSWKSSGCAFIDGTFYWAIHRDKLSGEMGAAGVRQMCGDASIIKSSDYGKSWTRSEKENFDSPMFPGATFATPYFVDYGRSRAIHGADRYVYATSNNGFWDNADTLILARIPRAQIGLLRSSDWQFFVGGDGFSDANWVRDPAAAKPILEAAGKCGETGAVYLPARGRYLMISWYYPGGGGYVKGASATTVWDFYEAPKPWGPWVPIGSHAWTPQGYYCPIVCPKFQTATRVYAITAGDFLNWWDHYHLTLVPIDLS